MNQTFVPHPLSLAIALLAFSALPATAQETETESVALDKIVVNAAAEALLQAPGSTVVNEKVLEERPINFDVSEIVRTLPGVNLTGNSNSGQRGNNRQIDIRGMGPENTLILIDGKPVHSRNAVKMGRSGERDTRGDSQWVPPDAIEKIEVLRGPAAVRYGSGSMGGVVNIITKRPEEQRIQITGHGEISQNSKEGSSWRTGILASGPLTEGLYYRSIVSYHASQPDDKNINRASSVDPNEVAAGREGVKNLDLNQRIDWDVNEENRLSFEGGFSRQGNKYAGDALFQSVDTVNPSLFGKETNVMKRYTASVAHEGKYTDITSKSYIQYERTDNRRLNEGLSGRNEGLILDEQDFVTIRLDMLSAKTEWNFYFANQTLTVGADFRGERMKDGSSNQQAVGNNIQIPGTISDPIQRSPKTHAELYGVYVEDNIMLSENFFLTPGVRADFHSQAGFNLSPSLNASWDVSENWLIKAGVSRAFKAPNLYQTNPNYVYVTKGNGCPYPYYKQGPCYIVGNPDLKNETSWNKEIGVNFHTESGWNAGLTYFHNDYKNRIAAGNEIWVTGNGTAKAYRWDNTPRAVIEGVEGNLNVPITDNIMWYNNATVMIRSEDKRTKEPLSLIPKYTINSNLNWQVNDDWEMNVGLTHYGRTESPKISATTGYDISTQKDVPSYSLVNVNTGYWVTPNLRLEAGVKNLFNKEIYREGAGNSAGANTFNEPGRYYTLGFKAQW